MNVVIDTSVWILALISQDGVSREIIRLALQDWVVHLNTMLRQDLTC